MPRKALRAAALVLVAAGGIRFGAADAQEPGYVTIAFGRTQWVTVGGDCRPLPNTVALDAVAEAFRKRGLVGTGIVVVNRTRDTGRLCFGRYTLHPSWNDLATLRDRYGWTFVSGSRSYADITQLSREQQWAESCGTLTTFSDRGHGRAWGLFGYSRNRWNHDVQANVVARCFAYGRTYRGGINYRGQLAWPWFQRTNSINGGKCNNPNLACYSLQSTRRRYTSPYRIASLMRVDSGRWTVIQMYRFVRDRYSSPTFRWGCSSPDWRNHWTSNAELYCWNDFLVALNRIPTGVVVTDPATVAQAWGRTPG